MQDDILTDVEQELVTSFNENEALKEAVRKVLTQSIYEMGVSKKGKKRAANINWMLKFTPAWNAGLQTATAESVGLKVMVAAEALAQLENAFERLSDYKKVVETKETINEAR